jgi:hypothetical protein
MKFYRDKRFYFWNKIKDNKLNAIHLDGCGYNCIRFLKNGLLCNYKNAAYTESSNYKSFFLNNKLYGNESDFTKESWRRFCKLKTFI